MYYEFREAQQDELGACFELRQSCYRSKVLQGFVDCDEFRRHDNHARHFGLFSREKEDTRLVGYVRLVEAFPETPCLPFLSHYRHRDPAKPTRMLRTLVLKHGMAVEGGRLSVPACGQQRLLAKHIAEFLTAIYGFGFAVPALVVAAAHHERFYESMGYRRILHGEEIAVPWRSKIKSVCMLMWPRTCPLKDAKFRRMVDAYARYGAIAYHPGDPNNFTPEYVNPHAMQSTSRLALVTAA